MQFSLEERRRFIEGKYNIDRFARRDCRFAEDSGVDGDEIKRRILEEDKKYFRLSHAERKAKAFAFVLQNTRISCDPRDLFPAINAVDRPLNATLVAEWNREVFQEAIPEVGEKRGAYERNGSVTLWPDFDHSVPVWDRLFSLGFAGILRESERARRGRSLSKEEEGFFEGIRITYEAISDLLGRLEKQAKKDGSPKLRKALGNIRISPPRTFYEALLVDYIYFMLSEHIEGLQVRSLGNFDRLFFPFYENDLKNGVLEEEIREDLSCFLLQFAAIGNYWNQPVFLGGEKSNGNTEINALSYLFLEVYDSLRIFNPKIQIKAAQSTPKDFLLKALDMIRRGNNSVVFVSDRTMRAALEKRGVNKEEARLCDVKGCYEYSARGAMGTSMNYLNLVKPLEYALHEGADGVTGAFAGRKSPNAESYRSFEEFYTEYKNQLAYLLENAMRVVNVYEDYLAYINPQSMLSATYPTCLERAKDALCGGAAENTTELSAGFVASVADSLAMIKKYVFDKRELTLGEVRDILDRNYEGNEKRRLKLLNDRDKYGNDKPLPDGLAQDIVSFVANFVNGKPNAKKRGGEWTCSFHVARMSYSQGAKTAATFDGRKRGEELSKNLSASMGQNREGATGAILSATKVDATAFTGDAALDLGLLPSAVKGEDGLEAMYGLLKTFLLRGGHAMQINVFSADTLREAQKNPEKYQDLQIRVCGWNVLWNNIDKTEQDGFIKQAESLV